MFYCPRLNEWVALHYDRLQHLENKHLRSTGTGSKFLRSSDYFELIKLTLLNGTVFRSDRDAVTFLLHTSSLVGYTPRGRRCYSVRVTVGRRPIEIVTAYPVP